MRRQLAERLLARIMGWSSDEKAAERAHLESLAAYKYDEYQQFAPGLRFIESLALWLDQFDEGAERKAAYRFVRDRLLFISADEMNHLVELTFPTIIRPRLVSDCAAELGIAPWRVRHIVDTPEYRARRRRTLVLGLSDGARTDWFRRANPEFSNEQVFHAYDVSDAKADDMLDKLRKDLATILGREPADEEVSFQYVILLDDFTGSGKSFIRQTDGIPDGKIAKFIRRLESDEDKVGGTIAESAVRVIVTLYVASEQARAYITPAIAGIDFAKGTVEFEVVHQLDPTTRLEDATDADMLALARQDRYYDPDVDDVHGQVGGSTKQLGFADGRLPLVLSHNTPNNSVYLLWAEDMLLNRGLFPRVSRHRKLQ